MSKDLQDFKQFLKERTRASVAFVNGDIAPLAAISAATSPATFFGPNGGVVQGADDVNEANAKGAQAFESGESTFDVLHMAASGDVAFWTGLQHAKVKFAGKPDTVTMALRVTEAFRREGGRWLLVHRHADPLVDARDTKGH
jgi:ketosteroid isomerase-like protein